MVGTKKKECATSPNANIANADKGFATGVGFRGIELVTNSHLQPPLLCTLDPGEAALCEQQLLVVAGRQHAGCFDVVPNILGQRTSKCPSAQKQPANGRLAHNMSGTMAHSTAVLREVRIARVRYLAFTESSFEEQNRLSFKPILGAQSLEVNCACPVT